LHFAVKYRRKCFSKISGSSFATTIKIFIRDCRPCNKKAFVIGLDDFCPNEDKDIVLFVYKKSERTSKQSVVDYNEIAIDNNIKENLNYNV
jgi:hypothetical protein